MKCEWHDCNHRAEIKLNYPNKENPTWYCNNHFSIFAEKIKDTKDGKGGGRRIGYR